MKNYKKKTIWYHISPNNLETNCILTICKGWQICTERQTLVFYWGIKSSNLENDLKSSRKTDDVHIKLFYNSAPIYPVEKLLDKCTEEYTRLLEHKTDGHIKSLNCLKKTPVTNYVFLSRHYQFHLGYLLLWLPRGIPSASWHRIPSFSCVIQQYQQLDHWDYSEFFLLQKILFLSFLLALQLIVCLY